MPVDLIHGKSIFGRPFKPVALGVTILMCGLVAIAVFNLGDDGRDLFDWLAAWVAALSAGLMVTGWITNTVRWAERGLAVATFAYMLRVTNLIMVDPPSDSLVLAIGVLIIIAGSYVMEANDRRGQTWSRS